MKAYASIFILCSALALTACKPPKETVHSVLRCSDGSVIPTEYITQGRIKSAVLYMDGKKMEFSFVKTAKADIYKSVETVAHATRLMLMSKEKEALLLRVENSGTLNPTNYLLKSCIK